ncbi:hypothetical protein E4H12_01920 [Candidatus Thorarchaeota archaeon]|nr:MAG: hypothetical protein E4H12_01920 [Candidatus Thorarchaeota archaeon]
MDHDKYIVFRKDDGEEYSVIFPAYRAHDEFAITVETSDVPISAGFVISDAFGAYVCFGKSVSLNLGSRPKEDGELVNSTTNVMMK